MAKLIAFLRAFLGLNYYTSELDEFLAKFDKSHPKLSLSQQQEKAKYARIYYWRDHAAPPSTKKTFWEKF